MNAEAINGQGKNVFEASGAGDFEKQGTGEKSYAEIGKDRVDRIIGKVRDVKDGISSIWGSIWSKAVEYGKKGKDKIVEAGYSALAVGEMTSDAAKYVGNKADQAAGAVEGAIDAGIDYAGEKITAGKDAVVEKVTGGYAAITEKGREGLQFVAEKAKQLKQNYDARVEAARVRREERLRTAEMQKLLKEYTDAHEEVNGARRRMYAAAQALKVQGFAMPA
jgi:hypothetical protein